jgi:hypothetical protein
MIYLVAILTAFLGGLLGRAFAFRKQLHRMLAFIVPVCLCVALLEVPSLIEMVSTGFCLPDWEALSEWNTSQFFLLLAAVVVTGTGWLCSYCVQKVFED